VKIVINAVSAISGGGVAYLRNLLPALGALDHANEYIVVGTPWQGFWDPSILGNCRLLRAPLPKARSLWRRLLWEQKDLPGLCRNEGADLLYCLADLAPLLAPCPTVVAVRNLSPYSDRNARERLATRARLALLRWGTWASTHRASRVVFASEYARDFVCQRLGVDRAITAVIYHGLNPEFSARGAGLDAGKSGLPYILYVSDIYPHKNVPFLVAAFARLCAEAGGGYELRIVGNSYAPGEVHAGERIATEAGIGSRVRFVGPLPPAAVAATCRGASFFVFPSLVEAFGQPLVEAMASGVPVVASDRTAIPEVCGDAALYFDPENIEDAVSKMRLVLSDGELRRRMIDAGKRRAATFSWERSARQLLEVLEEAGRPRPDREPTRGGVHGGSGAR